MNFAAIIEKIKTRLKKFSGGKSAEHTPMAKDQNVTEPIKSPTPRKDEKKSPTATRAAPKKEGIKKTATGNKPKSKKQ